MELHILNWKYIYLEFHKSREIKENRFSWDLCAYTREKAYFIGRLLGPIEPTSLCIKWAISIVLAQQIPENIILRNSSILANPGNLISILLRCYVLPLLFVRSSEFVDSLALITRIRIYRFSLSLESISYFMNSRIRNLAFARFEFLRYSFWIFYFQSSWNLRFHPRLGPPFSIFIISSISILSISDSCSPLLCSCSTRLAAPIFLFLFKSRTCKNYLAPLDILSVSRNSDLRSSRSWNSDSRNPHVPRILRILFFRRQD